MTEKSESHAANTQSFHEKLDALQFGQTLDEAKFLLVDEEPLEFAALVSRRMLGMQLGYILNRTVVFRPPDDPSYVACYKPLSNFTYQDIAGFPITKASFEIEQHDKVVRFDFWEFWSNARIRRYFYPWAPPEFASLKCARLIFDGETLSRLRLRDEFSQYVAAEKVRLGFEHPIVGLHVRQGSKEAETPSAPISVLMEQVEAICAESGANRVFVAGDASKALDDLPRNSGIDYLFDRHAGDNDSAVQQLLQTHSEPRKQETLSAVRGLELLSSCDWIVGRDDAHAARLAAARIGARTFRCDRHHLVHDQPPSKRFRFPFARS